jgi:hypothetical protein
MMATIQTIPTEVVEKMQSLLGLTELLIDAMRRENSLVSMHIHAHIQQVQTATRELRIAIKQSP